MSSEALCIEILGVLRRCFSQPAGQSESQIWILLLNNKVQIVILRWISSAREIFLRSICDDSSGSHVKAIKSTIYQVMTTYDYKAILPGLKVVNIFLDFVWCLLRVLRELHNYLRGLFWLLSLVMATKYRPYDVRILRNQNLKPDLMTNLNLTFRSEADALSRPLRRRCPQCRTLRCSAG